MSTGARFTIAIASLFSAFGFVWVGTALGKTIPAGPWPLYGMAVFCFIIALACLNRGSRPVTLRIIGGVIFVAYAIYVISEIGGKDFFRALTGFIVFGLPAGFVCIFANYPAWGKLSAAFRSSRLSQEKPFPTQTQQAAQEQALSPRQEFGPKRG